MNLKKNYTYADSLYLVAFNNYDLYSGDVVSALLNNYKIDSILNPNYIELAVKQGEFYRYIKFVLNKHKNSYNKRELKKLKRKAKRNRYLDINKKIRHLLVRDMFARSLSKKNIIKSDSINAIKLKLYLKKDSAFFDRNVLGQTYTELLEVLLFQQGWKNWSTDFEFLVNLVNNGYLNRNVTSEIIERELISEGVLFTIKNNKIISIQKDIEKDRLGPYYFYSSIGKRYYQKKVKNISMPIYPEINSDKLDEIRAYLCYSSFFLYKNTYSHLIFPTPKEYCKIVYPKK